MTKKQATRVQKLWATIRASEQTEFRAQNQREAARQQIRTIFTEQAVVEYASRKAQR